AAGQPVARSGRPVGRPRPLAGAPDPAGVPDDQGVDARSDRWARGPARRPGGGVPFRVARGPGAADRPAIAMCGVCGIVTPDGRLDIPPARRAVEAMITALAHRGPDDSGLFITDGGVLGATRLASRGLQDGRQPM